MRDPAPWQRRYDRMLIFALLFGLLSQYLFVGRALGLSVPLFVMGFYGLFFYAVKGRIGGFERWRGQLSSGWLLLVPIALLSLTYIWYANAFFRALNLLVLAALIVAQTMLLTRGGSQPWHRARFYGEMLSQWLVEPFAHLAVPFHSLGQLWKSGDQPSPSRVLVRRIAAGLLLALPLLLVVIALLASADMIFLSWMNRIPELLHISSIGDGIMRILLGGTIAVYSFCYIWGLLFRKAPAASGMTAPPPPGPRFAFDPVTAGTLLVSVNAVYILFVAIQFSYLFGAADGLLPAGTIYAEYARRGFAELVLVALINLGLLLGGLHCIRPAGTVGERVRKLLLSLLMGSTIVMLVSAYSRLALYEEAYGFTQTRLLVHGFMIFLGVLLLVALVRIWQLRFSLAKVYICTAIIAYLIMNFANLDALIAAKNVERFERTGNIDLYYLGTLSADAAPALIKLQDQHPELAELDGIVERWRAEALADRHWQSWNWAKRRLVE